MSAYTLDQMMDEQRDLRKLCADRQLVTEEVFPPNAFYGINHVLKSYAGMKDKYQVRAVVPHGTAFYKDYVWHVEAKARVPAVFNYVMHRAASYRNKTKKVIVPSASPFLYAMRLAENVKGMRAARKGTIFFPVHSTHRVTNKIEEVDKLIYKLENLDESLKPVTVCVYWKDFLHGSHLPYERKGFRVVSAGHIFDRNFLFRLYHLCAQHLYSSSNEVGSHIPYSVASGCKYFHMPGVGYRTEYSCEDARDDRVEGQGVILSADVLLSGSVLPERVVGQLANEMLGLSNLRSPYELAMDLEFARRLDSVGIAKYWADNKKYYSVPHKYIRKAAAAAKIVARIINKPY